MGPSGTTGNRSGARLHYGMTAKALLWLIVTLLSIQYLIGRFMSHIKSKMTRGAAMTWHVSIGMTILTHIDDEPAHPAAGDDAAHRALMSASGQKR